jgi:hypothetical protein
MPANVTLVKAAMALRGADSAMWAGFVGALREYADEVQSEMLRCAPEMLVRAQGMAIMANEIAAVLEDAPTLYDKLQKLQVGNRDGRPRQNP